MIDEEGTGRAPSAAPPEGLEALTEEIGRKRQELGETAKALVAKTDVTARVREKAAEVAGRVSGKASQVKETAAARMGSAGAAVPGRVRRAAKQTASRARQRPAQLAAAAGGALLAGWLIVRRRR